eukprot:11356071-Alexandrium_andersonii.AAC.1
MPKRGVSNRERAAAQAQMQSLQHKSIVGKIMEHLENHPEEAGPCLLALQDGLLNPNRSDSQALRLWLPDSNSQIRHVASYFLAAFLASLDQRFSDATVMEALAKQTKDFYQANSVPKDQQFSWARLLFARLTGAEMDHK